MTRLFKKYQEEIRPKLAKEFGLNNLMAVPKLKKVVINMGIKEAAGRQEVIDQLSQEIALMTGQKPIPTKAKKSISGFKLVKGTTIGLKVTLRRQRMYDFLDKLFNVVLPQVKDFKGLNPQGFDGQGNYTLGLEEQLVFPELDYSKIKQPKGLEVTIVTTAEDDQQAKRLLAFLGAPFAEEEKGAKSG